MQLYVVRDLKKSEEIVRRAEAAGYKALVVTVDTPHLGRRRHNVRERFTMPEGLLHANFVSPLDGTAALASANDASLNWEDTLPWLRSITKVICNNSNRKPSSTGSAS